MNSLTKKIVLLAVLCSGLIALSFLYTRFSSRNSSRPGYKTVHAVINNHKYNLYVAESEKQKEEGLSVFEKIGPDEGMLFKFDDPGYYQFWMKDMKFAIDIIFINESNEVTAVHSNVQPDSYPTTYTSPQPSDRVIELKSGSTQRLNLQIGNAVSFK